MRPLLACTALTTCLFLPAMAASEEANPAPRDTVLERVLVIGTPDRRDEIPGSATIVTEEYLERFQYTDVHRALKSVPGVVVTEEDGYGLRPNIGIRGGRSNRSADITLMEDGILAAPAPYAAPDAYYFPQLDRMQSIEVIKGTGAIKYGPRTTNGVVNLVTKQIPDDKQAELLLEGGSHGSARTGVTAGASGEQVGLLLNAFHKQSDGFKSIDFVGDETGYNVEDVMGKFRLNTKPTAERYQEIEFKLGYYDEVSDETYLGLTPADFAADPERRYGASQLDEMDVRARQNSATHYAELADGLDLTSSIYRNTVDRSWYRLSNVQAGGSSRTIASIFDGTAASEPFLDVLRASDTSGGAFTATNNQREYLAKGAQSTLGVEYGLGETSNRLEIGGRYHEDEEDRYQRRDTFDLQGGQAVVTAVGAPGSGGNRIQSSEAWSGFVQNELSWRQWTLTPGLRYEHIDLRRQDYGTSDPSRSGSSLRDFESSIDVWIPGVGASYAINEDWKLLGGVHKGFAPPGTPGDAQSAAFTQEEESVNYEAGTRYAQGPWNGELFAFFNDYDNLLGRDTFSSGGTGSGDAFNGGQVEAYGIEAVGEYDAAALAGLKPGYRLPLGVSYTFLRSEFQNSFNSSFEEWGNVRAGDELPYTPRHQLYLSVGLETPRWGATLGAKFTDEMRSRAGSGSIPSNELIEAQWTLDAAAEYHITEQVTAYTTVKNLLDEDYVAARRPAGLRPGLPFTALAGLKIRAW